MTRPCHQPPMAELLGDRERLLGSGLSGGVVTAEAFHLRQVSQRHRPGPDEPGRVLPRRGNKPVARLIQPAERGMGEGDTVVQERQAVADTGGDHASSARLESLERFGRSPRVDIEKSKAPGRPSFLEVACSLEAAIPQRASSVTVTGGVRGVAKHEPVPGDQLAQAVATRAS